MNPIILHAIWRTHYQHYQPKHQTTHHKGNPSKVTIDIIDIVWAAQNGQSLWLSGTSSGHPRLSIFPKFPSPVATVISKNPKTHWWLMTLQIAAISTFCLRKLLEQKKWSNIFVPFTFFQISRVFLQPFGHLSKAKTELTKPKNLLSQRVSGTQWKLSFHLILTKFQKGLSVLHKA